MNVAYHLNRMGLCAVPVTAVGRDFLGEEILRRFEDWGLSQDFVTVHEGKPTGAVRVVLDDSGVPKYDFLTDVAWDWLAVTSEVERAAGESAAVLFGTLALREAHNREQLDCLLTAAERAWKVFDVNLRPPYNSIERVRELMPRSDLLKVNDEELEAILGHEVAGEKIEEGVRELAAMGNSRCVSVTAGSRGAGLLYEGAWHWEPGQEVEVRDTVGAGDAFMAMLLRGLLSGTAPADSLRQATRMAEFVAKCDGATPDYSIEALGLA